METTAQGLGGVWLGTAPQEERMQAVEEILAIPDTMGAFAISPYGYPEDEWYTVDVLTCAAPNLRETRSNAFNPSDGDESIFISDTELQKLHEKWLRRIINCNVINREQQGMMKIPPCFLVG